MATTIGGFPTNFPKWLKGYFTDDSTLGDQAAKIAAGIVDPQVAEINRAAAAKAKMIEGQGMAGAGVSDALSKLYAPIAGDIQNAYQTSADAMAGYAKGLTGAGADAAQSNAADAAATIARLGAPGALAPSQAPAAMDTAYYTGGVLPANSLSQEASNRYAEAKMSGIAGIAAINQQMLSQQNVTRQEMTDLQAKGVDIENTRPAETLKALLDLRAERRDRITLGMDIWGQTTTQARQAAADKAAVAAAKLSAKYAAQKNVREQQAFNLQVKDYMRKTGQDAWAVAKQLSQASGFVYTVKGGVPVRTGQRTVDWQKQHQANQVAKTANQIRRQNANTQQHKAAVAADAKKGTGGLTANQVTIRENTWMGGMAKQVDNIIGAVKTTFAGQTTYRPTKMPPKKAVIVHKIYNLVAPQLVGKIPRWTPSYLNSLINAYVNTLPNAWWDPKTYRK